MEQIMVVKEFTFDAAHRLPEHPGPCKNLHGHTYRLQVGVRGPVDPKTGMVIDFGTLKRIVVDLLSELDHSYLNEVLPNIVPTAENIVCWIQDTLTRAVLSLSVSLVLIRLWETPTSYAEWKERE